jgi:hypothetical protein
MRRPLTLANIPFPVDHRSEFIKQFGGPKEGSGIVCFKFWELVIASGCPFRCSYCFFQTLPSVRHKREALTGLLYSNWRQMLDEVEQWLLARTPRMLIGGELQDGLVFDNAYKKLTGKPLTHHLIPLFAGQHRHQLIFLTKSTLIKNALQLAAISPEAKESADYLLSLHRDHQSNREWARTLSAAEARKFIHSLIWSFGDSIPPSVELTEQGRRMVAIGVEMPEIIPDLIQSFRTDTVYRGQLGLVLSFVAHERQEATEQLIDLLLSDESPDVVEAAAWTSQAWTRWARGVGTWFALCSACSSAIAIMTRTAARLRRWAAWGAAIGGRGREHSRQDDPGGATVETQLGPVLRIEGRHQLRSCHEESDPPC